MRSICLLFALTLALQIGFAYRASDEKPELEIVTLPPSDTTVKALSMGDEQFYFRILAFTLQNMGDTFGRFTSLKLYDFERLSRWFMVMDTLDPKSDFVPTLATYYFAQTQNTPDVKYIADYIYQHAMRDPDNKWWWLLQGTYLTMHKLKDKDYALKMVEPMVRPAVPVWAQQYVAVIHEKRGEFDDALRIMNLIKENATSLKDHELKYMEYFVKERIQAVDKLTNQ